MRIILAIGAAIAFASLPELGARAEGADAGAVSRPQPALVPVIPADAGAPPGGYLPDPQPLVTRHQWVVDLAYRTGAMGLARTRRLELAKPAPTARVLGRFAIELYVGKELIDRVRFDFPLLGGGEVGGPARWDSPPTFEHGLVTQMAVVVPDSERATRALLVDRATGAVWLLPWPFRAAGDAGAERG